MVAVLFIKLLALTQQIDYLVQRRGVKTTSFHQLVAFFISRGEFDLVHQSSSAALSSSMLAYPFTSGSRDIRLASAIAFSVCALYCGTSTANGSPPRRTH
nr:MAG TPA: hypothetical protein [Caudoviricetes sp.]